MFCHQLLRSYSCLKLAGFCLCRPFCVVSHSESRCRHLVYVFLEKTIYISEKVKRTFDWVIAILVHILLGIIDFASFFGIFPIRQSRFRKLYRLAGVFSSIFTIVSLSFFVWTFLSFGKIDLRTPGKNIVTFALDKRILNVNWWWFKFTFFSVFSQTFWWEWNSADNNISFFIIIHFKITIFPQIITSWRVECVWQAMLSKCVWDCVTYRLYSFLTILHTDLLVASIYLTLLSV